MPYLLAFLGFAALIILHEAGHFAAAKAVGMRVERFSLFFGPLLFRVRKGETEYGVGPIPLGGYVKITGMNPREELAEQEELGKLRERMDGIRSELDSAPAEDPQRFAELTAERDEVMGQIAAGEAELAEIQTRAYYNQPVWKRVVVILAGPAVNLLIAFFIVWGLVLSHGQPVPINRVALVEKGKPAAAHLKPGDQILSVDGVGPSPDAIRRQIATHHCAGPQLKGCPAATPARVVVRRGNRVLVFKIRPRYNAQAHRPQLGFGFDYGERPVGPGQAASLTVTNLWKVTKQTVSVIVRIVEPKERKQLHGVVGGYTIAEKSFAASASLALWVLALISLSLGIINLFPFLPLDGGHVFWALAEKVRGRRIPFSVMERASAVGFVLIVVIFVIGLSNDISTLTGPGFSVR
ncbi:MAG: M50 family metallopeptidase [Solirubrobacteraceae bacterium]